MPDPFEALRTPITPADPDPGFAVRLRARMVRALSLPEGADMTRTDLDQPAAPDPAARRPNGTRQGDLAHVSYQVADVERALAFYGSVLGWTYDEAPPDRPARPVHDSQPMTNVWPAAGAPGVFPTWRVDDMAAALERVRAAGGSADPVVPEPFGLLAQCTDDQGTPFGLWEPTPEDKAASALVDPATRAVNGSRQGDISYLTLEVADSARARAFYGSVLGWRFQPGRVEDGWGVEDVAPMHGMHGGHARPAAVPMFRVDDVHGAVGRVRAAGGTATDPVQQPYGWTADCVDDQGLRFYLGQM